MPQYKAGQRRHVTWPATAEQSGAQDACEKDTENKHAYCTYPWSGTWFRCSDRYLEESFGDPHPRHLALVFYKWRGAKADIALCV